MARFKFIVTRVASTIWKFIVTYTTFKFVVTQQNDFNFVIKPAGYWILRDGTWDDNGVWIDSEVWKDS